MSPLENPNEGQNVLVPVSTLRKRVEELRAISGLTTLQNDPRTTPPGAHPGEHPLTHFFRLDALAPSTDPSRPQQQPDPFEREQLLKLSENAIKLAQAPNATWDQQMTAAVMQYYPFRERLPANFPNRIAIETGANMHITRLLTNIYGATEFISTFDLYVRYLEENPAAHIHRNPKIEAQLMEDARRLNALMPYWGRVIQVYFLSLQTNPNAQQQQALKNARLQLEAARKVAVDAGVNLPANVQNLSPAQLMETIEPVEKMIREILFTQASPIESPHYTPSMIEALLRGVTNESQRKQLQQALANINMTEPEVKQIQARRVHAAYINLLVLHRRAMAEEIIKRAGSGQIPPDEIATLFNSHRAISIRILAEHRFGLQTTTAHMFAGTLGISQTLNQNPGNRLNTFSPQETNQVFADFLRLLSATADNDQMHKALQEQRVKSAAAVRNYVAYMRQEALTLRVSMRLVDGVYIQPAVRHISEGIAQLSHAIENIVAGGANWVIWGPLLSHYFPSLRNIPFNTNTPEGRKQLIQQLEKLRKEAEAELKSVQSLHATIQNAQKTLEELQKRQEPHLRIIENMSAGDINNPARVKEVQAAVRAIAEIDEQIGKTIENTWNSIENNMQYHAKTTAILANAETSWTNVYTYIGFAALSVLGHMAYNLYMAGRCTTRLGKYASFFIRTGMSVAAGPLYPATELLGRGIYGGYTAGSGLIHNQYSINYSFQIPFTPEGVQKLVSAFDVPVRPPNSPALTAAQAIERYENTLQRLSVLEQQIRTSNVGGALLLEDILKPLQERRVALIQQMLRERGILAPGVSLSATQLELIHRYGTSAHSFLLAERANAVTGLAPTAGNFQVRFNGAFRSLASIELEISQMAIGAERTALEQFLRGRRIALIQQMCPDLNLRQALTAPVVTRIQAIFGTTQTFTTLEDLFHFAHARSCLDRAQIPNIIHALEEAGVPHSMRARLLDTGAIGRSTAVVHPPHLRTTPPLSAATHAQVASRFRSFRNGLRNVARSPLGPGLAGLGLLLSGMESMSARISREEFLKRIDAELLAMHFTRSGAGENATYTNGSIVIRLQDLAGIQNARVYSAYANTGAAAGALFVELLVAAEGGGAAAGPIGWVVAGVCITVHIGTEAYQRSEGLSTIAALPPFILAFAPEQYLGSDPWQFVETTFFDLLRGGPNARNTQTDARDKALFGLYSLFLKQSHPEAWIDLIQKKTPSQLNDFYVDFLQQVKPMFIAFLLRDVPGHNYSNVSDSAFNTSYAFNRSHSREQIRSALESAFVFQYGEFLMQDYADRWRFYFNEVRLHGEDSANAQEALAFVHQMSNRIVFGQRLIYWFTYAQLQPNNQTRPSFLQRLEAGENPNTPAAEMRQQIIQRMVQDQIMPNGRVFAEQGQWQFVFSRQNLSLSIPRSGHNIFDEIDEQRARLGLPREMTETAESAVLALNDCSFNIAAEEGVQAAPLTLDNILSLPNGRHVPVLSQHFVEPRSIGPIPNEATAVYVHRISPDVQLIVCLCGSGEDGQILRYRTISRFGNAPWQTRTTDTLMQAPENNAEDAYLRQLTQLLQPSVGEATALLERQRDEARNGLISLTPSYIDRLHRMTYVDAQGVHQVSLANVPTGFGINNQNGALIFTMNTLRNPNFPNDFIAQNTYRIANAADVLALPNLVRDRILFLLTRLSYQQSLSAILFLFPLDQQNQMGGMTRSGIASRLLPLLSQMDEAQRGIVLRSLFTELHTYQQTGNLPQPGQFFGILQSVGSQLATFNVFGAQNAVLRGTGQPALKAAQELLATPAGRMDVIIQLALNGLSAKQIPMETWAMLYRLQHILSYRQSMPPYPNFSAAVQNGPLMNARHEALEKQGKELRIRLEQMGNSLRGPDAAQKLTQVQTDLQALWKEIQEREKAIQQLTQDIQSTTKQNTESQQKEKAQNEEWSKALIEAVQRGPDGDPLQMNENTYLVPLGNNRAVILRLMPNGSLRFYVINGAQEIGINPVLFQNLDDEALYAENDPAHPMPPDIAAARNTLLQRIAVSRAIQTLGNSLILQYPEGQEHLRIQLGQLFGQLAVQGMTALTFAEVLQKAVQNFMQTSNTTSITLNSYSEMQQFIERMQADVSR